jgi:hypothetical protein
MDADFLACLRCPIDPSRDATLNREADALRCSRCHVTFPVRNGIPVLIADEADLGDVAAVDRLPCRTKRDR